MFGYKKYLVTTWLFLAAAFLSSEVWLQSVRHTSFCTTSACDVVGEYVRFGEGNLIKMGAAFFWFLWVLVFFAGRYDKKWLWGTATLVLMGALAFDGSILGFQFMGLKEKCLLCIGVGSALFISCFLYAWLRKSFLIALLGIAVWSGGFAANSILDLNVTPPAILDTVFTSYENTPDNAPQHVLFFSLHCDHCAKILANLSINAKDLPGKWHLASTDNKEDDLFRLATIMSSNASKENLFLEALRIESLEKIDPVPIPDELRRKVHESRAYFKMKGFQGIPVLVVMEKPGWEMILRGEGNILEYLRIRGYLKRELYFPENPPAASANGTAG